MVKRKFLILLLLNLFIDFYYCYTFHSNDKSLRNQTSSGSRNKTAKSVTNRRQQKSALSAAATARITESTEPDFLENAISASTKFSNSFIHNHPSGQVFTSGETVNIRHGNIIVTNLTAILGQNILLPCAVRNLGLYNILWLRVRDGDVLAFDDMLITQDNRFKLIKKSANESNLLIHNVKLADSGEYACQINTQTVKSKFINLIVLTPPAFSDIEISHEVSNDYYAHLALAASLVTPESHHENHQHHNNRDNLKAINVVEGKSIDLECNAVGNPKPIINWYIKRFKSENLTVFKLNTTKIYISNVMRKQYDYFECEAINKVSPSITRKFKINVQYRPEVTVTPSKVYLASKPVQVRFNCSTSSYPMSNIYWMRNLDNLKISNQLTKRLRDTILPNNQNNKRMQETHKHENNKVQGSKNQNKNKNNNKHKHSNNNNITNYSNNNHFLKTTRSQRNVINPNRHNNGNNINDNYFITNVPSKYEIHEHIVNETFKISTLVINVDSENDLGVYECFSNNTAGGKSVKFYIHGDQAKLTSQINEPTLTTKVIISSTTLPDAIEENLLFSSTAPLPFTSTSPLPDDNKIFTNEIIMSKVSQQVDYLNMDVNSIEQQKLHRDVNRDFYVNEENSADSTESSTSYTIRDIPKHSSPKIPIKELTNKQHNLKSINSKPTSSFIDSFFGVTSKSSSLPSSSSSSSFKNRNSFLFSSSFFTIILFVITLNVL